jgi:glucosamine--fructose-6-phosphate aminotransferase (isomerizing)
MCGIVAYKGQSKCLSFILDGLQSLEYRGYDSAGISYIVGNNMITTKQTGSIEDLRQKIKNPDIETYSAIGHTRWATHGKPCKRNSHPHVTNDNKLAIAHNGIIENYEDLKKELSEYSFVSDTDSEVLLYLIYHQTKIKGSLIDGIKSSLEKVIGAYAIVILDGETGQMIAARKGSPLVVGFGVNETMVASDVGAFGDRASVGVVYLEDNVVVEVKDRLEVFDMSKGIEIDYEIEKVYSKVLKINKGDFDSYMLKEIYEQPKTVHDCLSGRLDGYRVKLGGLIGYENIFKKANHITIVSCGSSWHASLLAKYYIEELCKIKVSVEYASEFRYRKPVINEGDIVIGVSQSGETADTLGALEIAKIYGAITVGICNVVSSSMSKLTNCGIHLRSGVEVGVASTKTFTNQVICLLLLALWIEQIDGVISVDYRKAIMDDLRDLPNILQDTLGCCDVVEFVAEEFVSMTNCLFLGRGYNFPVALEGALKLKEISYVHAEGYPAAEMKHGPIALIDRNMPVVVVANNYENHNKIINNIKEIQARDGKVIGIYSNYGDLGDYKIRVPSVCDALSPLVSVVPLQLFSYYSAILRNKNVDKPRNLAKSVTVE